MGSSALNQLLRIEEELGERVSGLGRVPAGRKGGPQRLT
jgi:hypothetical protein